MNWKGRFPEEGQGSQVAGGGKVAVGEDRVNNILPEDGESISGRRNSMNSTAQAMPWSKE